MPKAKVIIFDLFETLIHDIKFDFTSGLLYLHENVLFEATDKLELLNYADTYWKNLYDKRNEDNSELPFEEELLDFKNKYGFKVDLPTEEIQYNCVLTMNPTELFNETISTLEKLNSLGIPVYLLSNSIFKKNVMKKFINQYELEKYFVNTYFSADYKVRKPHKDFFQVVFDDIQKDNKGIENEEVFFIGDNYDADVLGAKNFGFTPVFLNRKHVDGINNKGFLEINSLNELFELMT
ncbi:HAD family hydrolase [Inconstantimicrobium mannanitabidum]|uniref:Uncharacterized protein n=1 Tax=Inconstantimicrobium mannanitabidum TaxID=1604901 RepID=A0ACB5R7P3_9CLOT|nr:HAD family hydrolase [Clostridium sp. TW13]GKX65061.1 hypothetical protein rsdtw13_03190 [Clostridium sp. TW13]